MKIYLFFFLLTSSAWAKIQQFDVLNASTQDFDFKEVCRFFGYQTLPLVEAKPQARIDCMGSIVSVQNFCLKKFEKTGNLLRGFIRGKKAVCERGDRLSFEYLCEGKKDRFCQSAQFGCKAFGEIFAVQHKLQYHVLAAKKLSCQFSRKEIGAYMQIPKSHF